MCLVAVNAGQLANTTVDDSLAAIDAVLSLQLAMGLPAAEPTIALADSLVAPADSASSVGEPLPVAAAAAGVRAQERALTLVHRSLFAPSFEVGVEAQDPSDPTRGLLPTFGIALPLPLFNWSGGEAAQVAAARDRARAELELVRRETAADLMRAQRELTAARARVRRDQDILASADRVAAMSLQAYAEGAVALANVLEAQRNAREALGRYIDDLAAADGAAAAVRLLTTPADQP